MNRMLLPILKKYWKPLLATMIIASIGCCYMIGIFGGYLSLKSSLYDYVEQYGYPDAFISTAVTDRSKAAALEAVPGVEAVNARAVADTVLRSGEGRTLSVRCFSFSDGDMWRMHTWSSADGGGADELYLEYSFAKANGIEAGDTVQIRLVEEWRELFVGAIVSAPETMTIQPTETGWTLSGDFGYAYVSTHLLEKEYDRLYGEAKSELDEKNSELADARRAADEALREVRAPLDESAALLAEKDALLTDSRLEAAETRSQLLKTRSALVSRLSQLRAHLDALENAQREAIDALAALKEAQNGLAELDSALEALGAQETELTSQRMAILEALQTMTAARQALTDVDAKLAELDAQEAELRLQRSRLDEAQDGLKKIDETRRELDQTEDQIVTLRRNITEALNALDTVNAKLAEVEAQEQKLTQPSTLYGIRLLRLLPEKTPLNVVLFAMDGFRGLISSPQAKGFYPTATELSENAGERLERFSQRINSDKAYLISDDTRALIERIEAGESGVEDTPAYQGVTEILSRYYHPYTTETLPTAVDHVHTLLETVRDLMDRVKLDAVSELLSSFDAARSAESLADSIDRFHVTLDTMNSAQEAPLETVGEVVDAYDGAVSQLAAARAELTRLQRQLSDTRAAALAEVSKQTGKTIATDAELFAAFDSAYAMLADGYEQLFAAERQINEALDEAARELEARTGMTVASRSELGDAFDSLLSALTDGREELLSAKEKINAALAEQDMTEAELTETLASVDEGLASLADGMKELRSARAELVSELEAKGLSLTGYATATDALNAEIRELEETIAQIDANLPPVENGIAQVLSGISQLDGSLAMLDAELDDAERQLEAAHSELEESESAYQQSLADKLLEFASLEDELEAAYAELEEGQGFGALCNQFLLWFEDGADPEATLSAAKAALGDVKIKSDYDFEHSPVKARIDANLSPIYTMSTFIPTVYFAVVTVIIFLFMSLIVRQSRREIGILRAVGHSVGSIRGLFSIVSLLVSLAAIVLGFIAGLVFTWFVGMQHVRFFTLPFSRIRIAWGKVLLCFFVNIAVGQLATLVSTGLIAKISPTEAMSRPAPSTVRIPGFLGRLTRRAKPMTAFSITTLFRNPLRFVVSTICVSMSIMMILSALSAITSNKYFLIELYEKRIQYDCQIYYNGEVREETLDELRDLGIAEDLQRASIYITDVSFDGKTESTVVTALEPGTELIYIYDRAGNRLTPSLEENRIVLEERLAKQLGAQIGDTVLVNGHQKMIVEDISFQSSSQSQYISLKSAEALESDPIGSVVCRIAPENEQKLLDTVVEQENYLYTVFSRLAYESTAAQTQSYHFLGWIAIVFGAIMGFLIVLNIARTNLLEKKKELCILRTMGFQHREISKSWFVQSIVQFVCACAVGLPLGRVVAERMMLLLSTEHWDFIYVNSPREYLITLALVALYIVASHLAAMRDLKRWDFAESVKDRE